MESAKAVIVIINHKEVLSYYELISLRQCERVLSGYPIWMVVPRSLNTNKISNEFKFLRFLCVDDKYLASYRAFNRFKINPFLYTYFSKYEYLLYYELDAFVFSNQLDYWCSLNYDYIGAPWMTEKSGEYAFNGVGNGGLSLRKICSHLRVLTTMKRIYTTQQIWIWYNSFNIKGKLFNFVEFVFRLISIRGNCHWVFNNYSGNEDEFWSGMGSLFSWFKIPESTIALKFSFEEQPKILYEINQNKLPFGCHAWYRRGHSKFWKPFIVQSGYKVEDENSEAVC